MNLIESYIDDDGETKIRRTWACCEEIWVKTFDPEDLEQAAWTPVCPKCGGFDGSFFA